MFYGANVLDWKISHFPPHHEGSYLLGGLRIRVDLLICGHSCLSLGEDEGCSDDGIEVEKSRSSKLSNSG